MTSLIVAASRNEVIGAGGTLPWYLPDDLRRFRRLTRGHTVLVGRLTHEDIVSRLGRPLPGRTSVVLSTAGAGAGTSGAGAGAETGEAGAGTEAGAVGAGLVWVTSLAAGLSAARAAEDAARAAEAAAGDGALAGEIFVIGGTSVYRQALPHVDRIYLTRVHREVAGDTVMPENWLDGFRLTGQEDHPAHDGESAYSFLDYVREPARKAERASTERAEGRGAAWTEERGTSDEGRRRLKGAPEAREG